MKQPLFLFKFLLLQHRLISLLHFDDSFLGISFSAVRGAAGRIFIFYVVDLFVVLDRLYALRKLDGRRLENYWSVNRGHFLRWRFGEIVFTVMLLTDLTLVNIRLYRVLEFLEWKLKFIPTNAPQVNSYFCKSYSVSSHNVENCKSGYAKKCSTHNTPTDRLCP